MALFSYERVIVQIVMSLPGAPALAPAKVGVELPEALKVRKSCGLLFPDTESVIAIGGVGVGVLGVPGDEVLTLMSPVYVKLIGGFVA